MATAVAVLVAMGCVSLRGRASVARAAASGSAIGVVHRSAPQAEHHQPSDGGANGIDTEWRRQYFDSRNSSYNRFETTISPANVDQLAIAWSAPVDSYVDPRAGPLVIDGVVYVGTPNRVFAFDEASGTERWSFPVGDTTVTGLARWKNLLYVTDVLRHAVFALDAATGHRVWTLSSEVGTTGPTVIGDKLLFNDFGVLRAVQARTGEPVWTASLQFGSSSFAARSGQTIYVGDIATAKVYAIDLGTGKVRWSFQAQGGIYGSVALSQGVAYFGTTVETGGVGGYLFAVDTATHQELWRGITVHQITSTPSVADGRVYVNSLDGLYAFDARTGAPDWTVDTGGSAGAPALANGLVFAAARDGLVRALDAPTGQLLWSFDPPGGLPTSVSVADGTVYFGNDQSLFAMRLESS